MNNQELIAVLAKMVDVIEEVGNQTANLISSGDPIAAIDDSPGSSGMSGSLRQDVKDLRDLFDKTFGDLVRRKR